MLEARVALDITELYGVQTMPTMIIRLSRLIGTVIAVIVGGAVALTIFAGLAYLSFSSQMAGYNGYIACNPGSAITRIEWFFGVRPTQNSCWPLRG